MGEVRRRFEVAFGSVGAKNLDNEIRTADTSLQGLERRGQSVARTLQAAGAKVEKAETGIAAATRKNAERRIRLLEDEEARRTRLLDLRQEREVAAAKRRGENLVDLEALHAKQRAELEEKIAAKAEREAERQAKAEERALAKARQVALADAEARARAIEDAHERELALIDVRHQKEIERARRQGRDLEAIQAAHARERADAIERQGSDEGGGLDGIAEGAEEARRSFGDAFDEINGDLNETYGRFGDVISRLGDFEDAIKLLSGFALVEVVQGSVEFVQKMYEMTDAGKAAKRQAEALAGALQEVSAAAQQLSSVDSIAALDPERAARLAARLTEAGAATTLYEEKLKHAAEAQLELNQASAELVDLRKRGAEGFYLNRATRSVEIFTRHTAALVGEAERARQKLLEKEAAARSLRLELEQTTRRQQRYIEQLGQEAAYIGRTIVMQAEYRVALARGKKPAADVLDLLAGFAARGVEAYDAVTTKVGEYSKAVRAASAETQTLAAWLEQNIDNADGGLFERLAALGGDEQVQLPWVDALLDVSAGDLSSKLGELTALAEGFAAARERDSLRRVELSGGDLVLETALLQLEERYAAEYELAVQHGDNVHLLTQVYEERRTRLIEQSAQRRIEAQAAEVAAVAGFTNQLGRAAMTLAKSVGASKGVLAGIERVMELALAAKEIAAGFSSAAAYDVWGAATHFAAAGAHVAAAVKFERVPGAKAGGGGGGGVTVPQLSSAQSQPSSSDLPRGGGAGGWRTSSTVIHIHGASDPRSARDTISDHYDQRGYGEVRFEQGVA